MPAQFYQGDLQSGIGQAIANGKCVVCFVADGTEASKTWEEDYLSYQPVQHELATHAVTLRLQAGSMEAGFLSAFCSLTEFPAVVVIHQGQLKDHIHGYIEREDFVTRLFDAMDLGMPSAPAQAQTDTSESTMGIPTSSAEDASGAQSTTAHTSVLPQGLSISPPTLPPAVRNPAPHTPLQDAAQHAVKKPSASAESKKPMEQGAAETPALNEETRKRADDAAAEVRKKRMERDAEVQRIKANIERDKEVRRQETLRRQRERQAGAEENNSAAGAATSSSITPRTKRSSQANIQVRLPSGVTIRRSFPSSANLNEVRTWVDGELGASSPPYSFRVMQPPLPTRELSAADESKDMVENELCPSATLVLKSIGGFTEAYSGGDAGLLGTVRSGITTAFGLAGSAVGAVAGAVGGILSTGPATEQTVGEQRVQDGTRSSHTTNVPSVRVRTLADQRKENKDEPQLYNGNQLNFQRKKDDDDEDAK